MTLPERRAMVDLTIEGRKREAHLLVKVGGREDEVARRCHSCIRRGPAWAPSRRSTAEVRAGGAGRARAGLRLGGTCPGSPRSRLPPPGSLCFAARVTTPPLHSARSSVLSVSLGLPESRGKRGHDSTLVRSCSLSGQAGAS